MLLLYCRVLLLLEGGGINLALLGQHLLLSSDSGGSIGGSVRDMLGVGCGGCVRYTLGGGGGSVRYVLGGLQ